MGDMRVVKMALDNPRVTRHAVVDGEEYWDVSGRRITEPPTGPAQPHPTPENVEPPKRLCKWWRWDGCRSDDPMCQWPNCPTTPENVDTP